MVDGGTIRAAILYLILNNGYSEKHIELNNRWFVLPFLEMKIRPLGCDTD